MHRVNTLPAGDFSRNGAAPRLDAGPQTDPVPRGVIRFVIDGESTDLSHEEWLADPGDSASVTHQLLTTTQAGGSVVVYLDGLLDLSDEARWNVLAFVRQLQQVSLLVTGRDGHPVRSEDLFSAALALIQGGADLQRVDRSVSAAVDAAAFLKPELANLVADRIMQQLRAARIKAYPIRVIRQRISEIRRKITSRSSTAGLGYDLPVSVADLFPGEPLPPGLSIPVGWTVNLDGVWRTSASKDGTPPSDRLAGPLLLTNRGREDTTGREYVTVSWRRDKTWASRSVPRGTIADRKSIVGLADFGCPVTSTTAALAVDFLADFERENEAQLPTQRICSHLGWHHVDGQYVFLLGDQCLTAEGTQSLVGTSEAAGDAPAEAPVTFSGEAGDPQLRRGFRQCGTFKAWKEAVTPLSRYPRARLILYAALASPLLRILGQGNFVIDVCGPTSVGKTTLLKVAASCWGFPQEKDSESIIAQWNVTRVWFERAAAVRTDLPLLLDDSKLANNRDFVAQAIYDITSETGRSRGTTEGTARTSTFHTILITTGETPAVESSGDGGTRARTLTIWGQPFGAADQKTGELVTRLSDLLLENYGQAGAQFVRYLLQHQDQHENWTARFKESRERYRTRAGNNAVLQRLAAHFAVLDTAAWLAHEALDLPWSYADPVEPLREELAREAGSADRAREALDYVLSWAQSNQNRFNSGGDTYRLPPPSGWAGRWDLYQTPATKGHTWDLICFLPSVLDTVLAAGEYDKSVIRTWSERGWLKTDKGRLHYKGRMPKSGLTRFVAIKREAFPDLADVPSEQASDGHDYAADEEWKGDYAV